MTNPKSSKLYMHGNIPYLLTIGLILFSSPTKLLHALCRNTSLVNLVLICTEATKTFSTESWSSSKIDNDIEIVHTLNDRDDRSPLRAPGSLMVLLPAESSRSSTSARLPATMKIWYKICMSARGSSMLLFRFNYNSFLL